MNPAARQLENTPSLRDYSAGITMCLACLADQIDDI